MASKLTSRLVSRLADWRGDTRGVAAVEFGLIGGIFVLFVCFFFELGLTLLIQTSLDAAVRKESRLIKIGTIQASQQSTFLAKICADMSGTINCNNLQVNVASAISFGLLSAFNFTLFPNSTVNCAGKNNGQTLWFDWNDMGGSTDDKDYNDVVYSVSCPASTGSSSQSLVLTN